MALIAAIIITFLMTLAGVVWYIVHTCCYGSPALRLYSGLIKRNNDEDSKAEF